MTFAAFLIIVYEMRALWILERKYFRKGEWTLSIEEFMSRANLKDIIIYRHHIIIIWVAMGVMTISAGLTAIT